MNYTKKLAMSTPLSLVAIFLSFNIFAFTFTLDYNRGIYWKSFPIQMSKFVANSADAALLEQLANSAVQEWENVIGKNIWDLSPVQQTTNYTGNFIRWSDNFGAETGYDPTTTLALTVRYSQGTYFSRVVIILNGSIPYLRQNWGNTLRTTILHEVGHTIGLDHSQEQAIMAASLSNLQSLQPDDIQGANALVDDTLKKQSTGYVSPMLADQNTKLPMACGTVEDISRSGPSGSSGANNFVIAMFVGFLLTQILNKGKFFSKIRR